MKTPSPLKLFIVIILLSFSACVQPYSRKSFYKATNAKTTAIDDNETKYPDISNESPLSLSYIDLTDLINTHEQSEPRLTKKLQKFDPHWRVKGFDNKTGELFFFNFYSKGNKEALIWNRREPVVEYVSMNPYHSLSLIRDIKSKGYKLISHADKKGAIFSNNKTDILIEPVELNDGNSGYKFVIGPSKQ